jgi:hypothetical protein
VVVVIAVFKVEIVAVEAVVVVAVAVADVVAVEVAEMEIGVVLTKGMLFCSVVIFIIYQWFL